MRNRSLHPLGALRPASVGRPGAPDLHDPAGLQPAISGQWWRPLRHGPTRLDVLVSQTRLDERNPGAVSGGGQRAPGCGSADGHPVGPSGGRNPDGTPRFDQTVGPGAYLWWYVDGLSDCGRHAITLIAFVGSVFSPYYAWARDRARRTGGSVDAENYCAINVALYSPGKKRWTMTERSRRSVERDARHFRVGPSEMNWDGDTLTVSIDERSAPLPVRVRGTVRLRAERFFNWRAPLDSQGLHRWGPLAPFGRIEVDFDAPALVHNS